MSEKIKIVAIVAITSLEAVALFLGIDGLVLSAAVAAIAGIAGHEIGKKKMRWIPQSVDDEIRRRKRAGLLK